MAGASAICVTQQGRELRKRTLPPDPGPILSAPRQMEHWQAQAGEHRAELAALRSELTAAHSSIEAEKTHAGQRLADQQARYEDLVSELRTQIEAAKQLTAVGGRAESAKARERTGRAAPSGQQAGRQNH
jgi:chromosome segregation ATPase